MDIEGNLPFDGVMRAGELMQAPLYAQIIFAIEGCIYDFDCRDWDDDVARLKDSQVKSALRKVIGMFRKARSSAPSKKPQDVLKEALAMELLSVFRDELKSDGISTGDFVKSLLAVEDTLKLRREMGGHSRGYLEFLETFIPEARGE